MSGERKEVSLKTLRKNRRWSQQEVAEALGVEPLTVSRWERGYSSPSSRHKQLLCQLFGVSPQQLGFPQPPQCPGGPRGIIWLVIIHHLLASEEKGVS